MISNKSINRGILGALIIISIARLDSRSESSYHPFNPEFQRSDTIGIPLSSKAFDSLVENLRNKLIADTSTWSIPEYIDLVRVTNTIAFNFMEEKDKKYLTFYQLYLPHMNAMLKALDAHLYKGMSYYSDKYNLRIGGGKQKNNCFYLKY